MLTMTGLRGLGDACSDDCDSQYWLSDAQLAACKAGCTATPPAATASTFSKCMDACWPLPAGDPYNQCTDKCIAGDVGGRYGTATTVTKVPGGAVINNPYNVPTDAALPLCQSVPSGTSCFQPAPATNWWVVGALSALGVLAAVGTVFAIRRYAHAA